jgi:hypothetical protein
MNTEKKDLSEKIQELNEIDDTEPTKKTPSSAEALDHLESLILYFESSKKNDEIGDGQSIDGLLKLKDIIDKRKTSTIVQTDLRKYFK